MTTTAADPSTASVTLSAPSPPSLASPFNTLQHTALEELPKFTGESEQNLTQFIDTIKHIGSFTIWDATNLYTLTTIKLGGPALNWYNNNKNYSLDWNSLKSQLLARFQPSLLPVTKKRLKNRQ
jgi:hypothetical protein